MDLQGFISISVYISHISTFFKNLNYIHTYIAIFFTPDLLTYRCVRIIMRAVSSVKIASPRIRAFCKLSEMLTNFADLWSYGQLFYKLFDKLVNFDIFHYLFDHTSNVNLSQDFLIESFCNFKFKLILLQGLLGLYAYCINCICYLNPCTQCCKLLINGIFGNKEVFSFSETNLAVIHHNVQLNRGDCKIVPIS